MALQLKWLYSILLLFMAVGCVLLANEFYWIGVVPFALGIVFLAMYAMDVLLMIIVFCTPLAINLEGKDFGVALSLPTEPLMAGITCLFLFKILFQRGFDKRVLHHPVSIAIYIYLAWMFITCLTSTMPLVSLKHFFAKLWFICPFYFLATQMFRDTSSELPPNAKRQPPNVGIHNMHIFIWLYIVPLLIVIGYTMVKHQAFGFTQHSANIVMWPFYNDHTAYAAAIAMFLPAVIAFMTDKSYSKAIRTISFFIFLILMVALVLSYTRAAWISIAVALVVFLIFYFRIRFIYVFAAIVTMLVLFFTFQTQIFIKLEENKAQSATDFNKHLQSISNIKSDASNLERLNRWHSAMRMFREKPFFGWGPGTYQFKYASYQQAKDRTIISTNSGDRGNAHSEYIGPLTESGVLGLVTFSLLIIVIAWRAIILYSNSRNKEIRMLTLTVFLGLITYLVHGTLNNFLDTDKAAVPFWGFVAILVALDVYHSRSSEAALAVEKSK